MPLLDDPELYYGPAADLLSLGDIVAVPTGTLWNLTERTQATRENSLVDSDARAGVFEIGHENELDRLLAGVVWVPAMVVADDCALDKEENEYARRLVNEGQDEASARAVAADNPELDRFAPVSPVFPYEALRYASAAGIRQAQTVGYFPVVGRDGDPPMYEGFVDLVRITTVSRNLIAERLLSIRETLRNLLRYKLAEAFAARSLSFEEELLRAKGKCITDVYEVSDSKKNRRAKIELDNGEMSLTVRLVG